MSKNEDAIQTLGLSRKFGNLIAVNGINLSIKEGELFSLLGPNGAGKTTTIKMLCCLLKPTDGTAVVMGHDIRKAPSAVKQIINVSPQETAIATHLNALENLLLMGRIYGMSKEETKKRAEEFIELMGLTGRMKEQVKNFSGGMQRKLNIAMALISDSKVLFLDEPTLGLDPHARRELWKQIERLKGEKTILLTTHYLEEADALADRIAIIKEGNIIASGTPSELKNEFLGIKTMVIKTQNLTSNSIQGLKTMYPNIRVIENGIEIKAKNLVFDDIVDYLRSKGVKIEWLSMREPSLDDVFLSLTGEDVNK
jgi:ABC-2 type transport system ATP-binding protein